MTDKLVVDTCVFIEGIFSSDDNASDLLLSKLEEINHRLVFSQETIGELFYVIKKTCNALNLDPATTSETLTNIVTLFQYGKSINTKYDRGPSDVTARDPEDQMFIDAAFSSSASHIITLDKKSGILSLRHVPFKCCTPEKYLIEKGIITTEPESPFL